MTTRTIEVNRLARVEGEGRLYLRVEDECVAEARLSIFEPPRFFEALLQGRDCHEAPDITARICGICPVAYQISACRALENAAGVTLDEPIGMFRRLLYCGEWISSHTLHIHMLHAPDYLGYDDAIAMAKDHPGFVERGLRLKKVGNSLVNLAGGREIHPINVRLGGFYRMPKRGDLKALAGELKWARDAALEVTRFAAGLPCPNAERDYCFVGLRHANDYPIVEGNIVASKGLEMLPRDYEANFREVHKPHSTALYSELKGTGTYLLGPLARFNLNTDRLTPLAKELAEEVGLAQGCRNPFKSIVVRSIEVLVAIEEALRMIESYDEPDRPHRPVEVRDGMGFGATEAPRGMLWHQYEVDAEGRIVRARIVPPTSQNQAVIEEDVRHMAERSLALPDEKLQWLCEQTIRNYDPCISCAAHFLKLNIHRM